MVYFWWAKKENTLFIVVRDFIKSKKNTNGEEKRQPNHRGNYVNTLVGLDFLFCFIQILRFLNPGVIQRISYLYLFCTYSFWTYDGLEPVLGVKKIQMSQGHDPWVQGALFCWERGREPKCIIIWGSDFLKDQCCVWGLEMGQARAYDILKE